MISHQTGARLTLERMYINIGTKLILKHNAVQISMQLSLTHITST